MQRALSLPMQASRPLLFLDFDGVLHPETAAEAELFSQRTLLWELLLAELSLGVVISSTWRGSFSLTEMTGLLTAGGGEFLADRILGATPDLPAGDAGLAGHRGRECRAWREAQGHAGCWLAIDDYRPFFVAADPLYWVDSSLGLQATDLPRILERLGRMP